MPWQQPSQQDQPQQAPQMQQQAALAQQQQQLPGAIFMQQANAGHLSQVGSTVYHWAAAEHIWGLLS